MSEATPRPWALIEDAKWPFHMSIVSGETPVIPQIGRAAHGTGQRTIADCMAAKGFPAAEREEVVEAMKRQMADMRLIVRAVNLHDDLVAVCEKLLGEYLLFRSDSLYVNKIEEEARAVLARVDKEK